jgi:hypothetical protein
MKNRRLVSGLLAAGLAIAGAHAEKDVHAEDTSGAGVKWHPGHYIMVRGAIPDVLYEEKVFLGIQKLYNWKALEPQKDRYDFSSIKGDLAVLGKRGKRLVIQVQSKAFGEGRNVAPAYLNGPEYGGGVYKTSTGSFNPVIWNDKVNERMIALYAALGRELNSEPYLEAVVLPETAPSSNIGRVPQPGVDPYTHEKFVGALKRQMKALKDAFPNTVVIQYTNFPREALQELTDYQKEIGVGLGGPDVRPYDLGLGDPKSGVYRFYPQMSGIVPLGTAVQSPDYTIRRHNGPFEPTPVNEIYEFGRDKLRLNYMFWFDRPGYFDKVVKMMQEPSFPKDVSGGLDARCPQKLAAASTK